jgi:hypothetical protein
LYYSSSLFFHDIAFLTLLHRPDCQDFAFAGASQTVIYPEQDTLTILCWRINQGIILVIFTTSHPYKTSGREVEAQLGG